MAFGDLLGTLQVAVTNIATDPVATGSVAVSVGDLVCVVYGQDSGNEDSASCSDNLGNTYAAFRAGTTTANVGGQAYYSRVTVAGTLTSITVTISGAGDTTNDARVVAGAFAGPFAVSPLDVSPVNKTSDTTSPFTTTATGTLAQADELVVAWMACNAAAGAIAATSPNTLAIQLGTGSNPQVGLGYQVVSATTSIAPEFTKSSNPSNCILGVASFKKAADVTFFNGGDTNAHLIRMRFNEMVGY